MRKSMELLETGTFAKKFDKVDQMGLSENRVYSQL